MLSDCRRHPEAELHVEAGAEPERHACKRKSRRRGGRKHSRPNRGSSLQTRAGSPTASTDSSRGSTPEKEVTHRVGPASAPTTPAVEYVPEANCVNKAKRQRDSSPARVPAMMSGLTISDFFGDLASNYKAELERKSIGAYNESLQDPGKSLAERRYEGKATSGGDVSSWAMNHRRAGLKGKRQEYQNLAAAQHCEAANLCINNPFTGKACGQGCRCIPPSAGELLSRADLY